MSDWCILRTSCRKTLELAESLCAGGFNAWTPIERVRVSKKRGKVNAPFMPSWVFARSEHLLDLLGLADMPRKQQPDFSVFHYRDLIPLIRDGALDSLRQHERASDERYRIDERKATVQKFTSGESVKISEGAFAGMSGTIKRSGGKYSLVLFGPVEIEVANFWLHPLEEAA